MRGRAIFPFLAEFRRLATAPEDDDADPPVPAPSTYDPDFHEPIVADANADGTPEHARVELDAVRVRCQIESESFEAFRSYAAGDAPNSAMVLICHARDLKRSGLVDADTGDALIRKGDRLAGIYRTNGQIVTTVRNPPGLFVTEVKPRGFGLGRRPDRNLWMVRLDERESTIRSVG